MNELVASPSPVTERPAAAAPAVAAGESGYPLPLPTPRAAALVAASAVLVAGGAFHPAVAGVGLLLASAVVVAAVVEWLALPVPQALTAARLGEPALPLGADVDMEVEFRLRGDARGGPWTLRMVDDLHDRIARVEEPGPATLDGRTPLRLATRVHPRSRGRFALGPVHARLAGRLGLAERQIRFSPALTVRVVPGLAEKAQAARILRRAARAAAGQRRTRWRGQGTSFESLREYVQGDDPRHVDWKSSARHDKLITRLYEVERSQSIVFMIDAGRWMTADVGELTRFDRFLNAALLLAQVASRRDDRVGAMVFDSEVRAFVPPSKGRACVAGILDAVLDIQPRMVESDYRRAFAHLARRHRKRSLIVVFTDVLSRNQSRELIDECVRSTRRHLPLVVTLRDAGLDALVGRVPENAAAAYEQAAAEDLLLEREQALAGMRAAGVHVVDVPPSHLAPAVVDRYLELKARLLL